MVESDFVEMKWRVDLLPIEERCLDKYEDLKERFEGMFPQYNFYDSLTNEQVIRYIIFCYHKPSPFIKKITEVKHRKNQALIQVGFNFKEGVPEDVKRIINNEDEKMGQLIHRFLMFENNPKFAALIMSMDAYYKFNYQLAYTEVKSIKGMNEAITELGERIESLSHDVYSGDNTLNNFATSSALKGFITSPEQNAYAHKSKI